MLKVTAQGLAVSSVIACLALSGTPSGAAAARSAAAARLAAARSAAAARAARAATAAEAATADSLAGPAYPTVDGRLSAVAAASATDVWAVGDGDDGGLIMRWNGARWSTALTPPSLLTGVAAVSATDVWAVGSNGSQSRTAALRWNGRSWTPVSTPTPKGGGTFSAAAAASSTDVWAVGAAHGGPLTEQWTGRRWAIKTVPALAPGGGFNGVAVRAANDAWAVGGAGGQTLIMRWNGTRWSRYASPGLAGAKTSTLNAVTMIAADNAWAVGQATMPGGRIMTLTEFWNGRRWRLIPSPTPGAYASLLGVTASWTRNIWAVGSTDPTSCIGDGCEPTLTLVLHWNGTHWKILPSPNGPTPDGNGLVGIAAVSRDDIWAAGWSTFETLLAHWNGRAWS